MITEQKKSVAAILAACAVVFSGTTSAYAAEDTPDAVRYNTVTYEKEIPYETQYIEDDTQFSDYRVVVQTGENGLMQVTAKEPTPIYPKPEVLEEKILEKPVDEVVVIGTKDSEVSLPLQTEDFIAPVDTGYVSNGFGGSYHRGVDIAAPRGTPIYATASGRVESVQYTNNGYGYYLIIDHGNDVKTMYAHNSEMYVEVGDWVDQGDEIAAVGSTGRSTGNHLQYEIHVEGKAINPSEYI